MTDEPEIQLYHFQRCPYCEKTRRALRTLHLDYDSHIIDPQDRSKVQEVSGQEQVPVITEGDTVVNDSSEIFEYLDSYHGNGAQIIPERDHERGMAKIFDQYADSVLGPLYYGALKEIDEHGDALDEEGKQALQHSIDEEAGVLNQLLSGQLYLVGASISMADLAVSAFLNRLIEMTNFTIDKRYEHLWDWCNRVKAQLSPQNHG